VIIRLRDYQKNKVDIIDLLREEDYQSLVHDNFIAAFDPCDTLSHDLVLSIFSYLPTKTLLQFNAISKPWQEVALAALRKRPNCPVLQSHLLRRKVQTMRYASALDREEKARRKVENGDLYEDQLNEEGAQENVTDESQEEDTD